MTPEKKTDASNLPNGAVWSGGDRMSRGMVTVSNEATAERVKPVPKTLPPVVSGLLGVFALLLAVPGAVIIALPASVTAPVWLVTASGVCAALTPFFAGLAFWANGGNPLDLLARAPQGKILQNLQPVDRDTPAAAPTQVEKPRVGPEL